MLVGLTVLALAFFVVPTRVHERYIFPFFALAVILAAASRAGGSRTSRCPPAFLANMYAVLVSYPDNPSIADWLGIGPALLRPSRRSRSSRWPTRPCSSGRCSAPLRDVLRRRRPASALRCRGRASRRSDGETDARLRAPAPVRRRGSPAIGRGRSTVASRPPVAPSRDPTLGPRAGSARAADLVAAAHRSPSSGSSAGCVPASDVTAVRPDRTAVASPRARRAPRPARPVAPVGARPGQPAAAHVPARRAVPDALRRGLPRPDRDRVPAGLALRHRPQHLRVDPSRTSPSTRWPAGSSCGAATRSAPPASSASRSAPRSSSRAGRRPARATDRPASASTSRPAPRSGRSTSDARPALDRPGPGRRRAGRRPGAHRLIVGYDDGRIATLDATTLGVAGIDIGRRADRPRDASTTRSSGCSSPRTAPRSWRPVPTA